MENINDVVVKYNGSIVGFLKQIDSKRIAFKYSDSWLELGFSISPFSLPLSDKVYISKYEPFKGLYGVFYDSLPDGWGELLMHRMLVKKGINPSKVSQLTKLTLVDNNSLGGLTYEPNNHEKGNLDNDIDFDELYLLSKEILEDNYDVDLDKMYQLGGSSGGTRPKVNMNINGESWIVKFPCRYDSRNIGEEEYIANKLAKECGINVADFSFFQSNIFKGYFASKRFDKINNKRIHVISLSSLLGTSYQIPNLDYLHLFQVINRISADKENDLYEAYRRMCFNVFICNRDDHGKNFSFIYDESKKGYVLSPAYDLTILRHKLEHEMTINGNGLPTEKDLLEVAKIVKLSMKKCKTIIDDIKRKVYVCLGL